MPVYEYRCKSCGKTHEIEHGFHDERPTACPSCGGPLVRIFHPVGVHFKGSGFYKTDHSRSGVRAAAERGKGEQKSGDSAGEKKTGSKAEDSKSSSDGGASTAKSSESKSSDGKSSDGKSSGPAPSGSTD